MSIEIDFFHIGLSSHFVPYSLLKSVQYLPVKAMMRWRRWASLTRNLAQKSRNNLSKLMKVDLRTAYIEVDRTNQPGSASIVARSFDRERLS